MRLQLRRRDQRNLEEDGTDQAWPKSMKKMKVMILRPQK
jgi:hypothetical protein